jgi:nicotinamidase/pyrazinamidase
MSVKDQARNNEAIIVVDPQPDFFEGGPLPIEGATKISERIAKYLRDRGSNFALTIVTQDWHISPDGHWSTNPNFVTSWPVHCVADTSGAEIHSSLGNQRWDAVIRKGQHSAAYSGFEGENENGTSLANVLSSAGVDTVTVVGFATDYCVKSTALDARDLGLNVSVLLDLCAGVDAQTTREAISEMAEAGVSIRENEEPSRSQV